MINHLASIPNTAASGASELVQGLMKHADLNHDGQATTAEFTRFLQDALDAAALAPAAAGKKAGTDPDAGRAAPVPPAAPKASAAVAKIKP